MVGNQPNGHPNAAQATPAGNRYQYSRDAARSITSTTPSSTSAVQAEETDNDGSIEREYTITDMLLDGRYRPPASRRVRVAQVSSVTADEDILWLSFPSDSERSYYQVVCDSGSDVTALAARVVAARGMTVHPPAAHEPQELELADGRRIARKGYVLVPVTLSFETGYFPPMTINQQFEVMDLEEVALVGKDLLKLVFPRGEHLFECMGESSLKQHTSAVKGVRLVQLVRPSSAAPSSDTYSNRQLLGSTSHRSTTPEQDRVLVTASLLGLEVNAREFEATELSEASERSEASVRRVVSALRTSLASRDDNGQHSLRVNVHETTPRQRVASNVRHERRDNDLASRI
jgi:hypothetical protein